MKRKSHLLCNYIQEKKWTHQQHTVRYMAIFEKNHLTSWYKKILIKDQKGITTYGTTTKPQRNHNMH